MLASQQKPRGTVWGSWGGARIARGQCQVSRPVTQSRVTLGGFTSLPPPHPFLIFKRRGSGSLKFQGAVVPSYGELRRGPQVLQVQDIRGLALFLLPGVSINWLSKW